MIAARAGRARVTRICNTVVRVDIDGHAYAEFAEAMFEPVDALLADTGRVFLGLDAEAMSSYDSRFRYLWTEWIKRHRDAISGVHMLFRSRVAESAAIVINAVTGEEKVETCSDRDAFEERLAAEVLSCRSRDAG